MIRVLQLGAEGEDAARHLLDVYELSDIFEPCVVISAHTTALSELRRRLAEVVVRVEQWEPAGNLAKRVRKLATDLDQDSGRPVIWLEAKRFEPETWAEALGTLNRQREMLRHEAPWMWVLAGPPELVQLIHDHAMHVLTGVSVRINLNEEPRRATSTPGPLRWLHLSDFHFQGLERWQRRATLQALLRHAEKLKAEGLAPHFVFLTGDVAYSGKRKEYEQAERFLHELATVLELEPRKDFFVVPGNHDVDRGAIGPADNSILSSLRDQEAIELVLKDGPTMTLLGRRLEEFYAFTERLLGPARAWREDRPWRVDVREHGGLEVGILQLNSAWASGSNDEQGLLVGEAQVREALTETADTRLRIALVHHPLADLHDADRERLETLLPSPGGAHFLLRGHLHRSRTLQERSPDGFLTELAAGAVYVTGDYPKTHFLTELDFAAGEARVRFFRYSPEGQGFWAPDTLAYENVRDGLWTFELPGDLRLGVDKPAAPTPMTTARRATLTARYRTASAAVHGTVRFVGFADSRKRRHVQVQELFVPLKLRRRGAEKGKPRSTEELAQRLFARPQDGNTPAARFMVLGDPGSGKTTLCRFLAVAAAGEAGLELDPAVEPLPLLLPFREYVRSCAEQGDQGLLAFLLDQAHNHLQVPISESFLENALGEGRAVLLLDGMDEVGTADEREHQRDRILAFCRLHPRLPVLVTSRNAGYDEAPLPDHGPDSFEHLQLAPWDDEDLDTFVTHWYAVQEPEDPVARDHGIADLTAALAAKPRVRELARNPMLATLVALVHRHEANLPGERAELYNLCIRTMLETWPAARRRQFQEIDERLQRSYLEALAYRMQQARKETHSPRNREVTIERTQLVATLAEIVQERRGGARETVDGLVARWVHFLEQGTGLLVEQKPGVFAFFHLSLMEYLAAAGMMQDDEPEELIVSLYSKPAWREVCLLAIGSRATDKAFLDRLFSHWAEESEEQPPRRWSFLLAALGEEAAFDDEQRAVILRRVAVETLDGNWRGDHQAFNDLWNLSMRHGEWLRSWLPEELKRAEGDVLQGLVLLRGPDEKSVVQALADREDVPHIAGSLLDFGSNTAVGRWAMDALPAERAADWACSAATEELLILRTLEALSLQASPLASPLVAGLAGSSSNWCADAQAWHLQLTGHKRPGGSGLPGRVRVRPGATELSPGHRWPTKQPWQGEAAPLLAKGFARAFGRAFGRTFEIDFARYFEGTFARYFARYFAIDFAIDFARNFATDFETDFARNFAQYFAIDFGKTFARYFGRAFGKYFGRTYGKDFAIDFTRAFTVDFLDRKQSIESPKSAICTSDLATRNEAFDSLENAKSWIQTLTARLAGDAWIAMAATAEHQPSDVKTAYLQRRLQNTWLLHVWPAIDDLLAKNTTDDHLALYLALGFSQATTTWQWPATPRWIEITGAPPPAHWLPRSQYHLCWLLYEPEDKAHQKALQEALEEGLEDRARPTIAQRLRQIFPP